MDIDVTLSDHFTLDELIRSDVATRRCIDNTLPPELLANARLLAAGLERVRAVLGGPVRISSGFRCSRLNDAVGGSRGSAHMKALAADFTAPEFGNPLAVCRALASRSDEIGFEQLIQEGTWTHIAFPAAGEPAHGMVMTATFGRDGVTYSRGLA